MSIYYRRLDNPDEFERIKIPVVKGDQGEKGDKGDTGEKGDRGERGVYVGDDLSSFSEEQLPDLWLKPYFDEEDIIHLEDVYTIEEIDLMFSQFKPTGEEYHTHSNLSVLNDLNVQKDQLTFKGKPIATGEGFDINKVFPQLQTKDQTILGAINEVDSVSVRSVLYDDSFHTGSLPGIDQRMDMLEGQFVTLTNEFIDLKEYVLRGGGPSGGGGTGGFSEAQYISVSDISGYFVGVTVESVLQEIGTKLTNHSTSITQMKDTQQATEDRVESLSDTCITLSERLLASNEQVLQIQSQFTPILESSVQLTQLVASISDRVDRFEEHTVTQEDYDRFEETYGTRLETVEMTSETLQRDLMNQGQAWQMSIDATNDAVHQLEKTLTELSLSIRLLNSRLTALETNQQEIPVAYLTLNDVPSYLIVGETFQLEVTIYPENATNQNVTYHLGLPGARETEMDCIELSETGLITAIRPGSASIYVQSEDGQQTVSCQLEVRPTV